MQAELALEFFLAKVFSEIYKILANILGLITHPYKTMKIIIRERNFWGVLVFLGLLPFWVLSLGILRGGLRLGFFGGFLRFFELSVAFLGSYFLAVGLIWFWGVIFGGRGSFFKILASWIYSYVPTFLWFGMAALFFIVLPPPRTTSLLGYFFSVFFVVASLVLFWWKALLYYLVMRFGMRLTFWRIFVASIFIFSAGFLYSFLMYKLGFFRVPFV